MRIKFNVKFDQIIDFENLLDAWKEFLKGRKRKPDVQLFQKHLMDNIFSLHDDLFSHTYRHGGYQAFNISDPKPRKIHKARVRDRLFHRAIYRQLYPFFDKTFVACSFSCRNSRGTFRAIKDFCSASYKVSKNNTKTCWVLKGDVKKFFANIDHQILFEILTKYIPDQDILWLLKEIIGSFHTKAGIGLPLGNLTSQLFANIYLNEFDQFVKHQIKAKYYLRYADDFVLLSADKAWLKQQIPLIKNFLWEKLRLILHPQKVFIKTFSSGVDFLGWVNFPRHKVIRTSTKKRLIKRIRINPKPETVASYLGLLKHGNTYKLQREILGKISQKNKKSANI